MTDTYSETEREIIKLTLDWIEAVGKRDGATLDRILDDDFLIVGWRPEGVVGDKKLYIEDCLMPVELEQSTYKYDRWQFRVRDDVVIATCIFTCHALVGGNPWGGNFATTYVWVNKEGAWKAIACHSSPVLLPQTEQ